MVGAVLKVDCLDGLENGLDSKLKAEFYEVKMIKAKEDMTGWNMWEHGVPDSRLTVVKQAEDYVYKNGKRTVQWLCKCNCKEHNQIVVLTKNLKSGHTKSCGCIQKEVASKIGKSCHKTNAYDLNLEDENGFYGIGYCSNTGKKFYFDMDDYDKIKDYCWYERKVRENYSSVAAYEVNSKKSVKIHNLICCKYCDHADRNPFNNRKYNLRKATALENARNQSIPKNNASGFIGVLFKKNAKKWVARIRLNNKEIHLGYFAEKEDAIKARLEAETKYFGEFAPQRHLFEEYGIKV